MKITIDGRELTPTDEQIAILDAARAKPGHSLMISADAGCAKSSTLKMLGQVIRGGCLGMAFNKSTAENMKKGMPGNFSWKTANGLGHGAWIRANPAVTKWEVDDRKLGKLISQKAKESKITLSPDQWDQVRQLANAAMLQGLTPDNIGRPLVRDDPSTWDGLADMAWIAEDDRGLLVELARAVLIDSIWLARKGIISFDDQVYCSVCLGGQFTQYEEVMTDESQDLNGLNHQMIALSTRPQGRLIAVGDPKQSLYAFRGALQDSMSKLKKLKKDWVDLSLHVTFRCPKAIVARQQAHAPGFTAAPGNPQGRFVRLQPQAEEEGEFTWGWRDIQRLAADTRSDGREPEIMIACRNRAPLMKLAFRLIRQRVAPAMIGRQLGKNLVAFSRKIVPEDSTQRVEAMAQLTEWLDKERSLMLVNGRDNEIDGIEDRVECVRAILEDAEARDMGQGRALLSQLFSRDSGHVTLGTGHGVKGLEYDLVVHLDPWRIPSKHAREAAKAGNPGPMEQERNIGYVIETRTKHTLVNANLEDFE